MAQDMSRSVGERLEDYPFQCAIQESLAVVQGRAPHTRAETQAEATFAVGDRVQRRDKGQAWGIGYVKSVNPLSVTLNDYALDMKGYSWAEVRHIQDVEAAKAGGNQTNAPQGEGARPCDVQCDVDHSGTVYDIKGTNRTPNSFGFILDDMTHKTIFVIPAQCSGFGMNLPLIGTRVVYNEVPNPHPNPQFPDHDVMAGNVRCAPQDIALVAAEGLHVDAHQSGRTPEHRPLWNSFQYYSGIVKENLGKKGYIWDDMTGCELLALPYQCRGFKGLPPEGTRVVYLVRPNQRVGRANFIAEEVYPEPADQTCDYICVNVSRLVCAWGKTCVADQHLYSVSIGSDFHFDVSRESMTSSQREYVNGALLALQGILQDLNLEGSVEPYGSSVNGFALKSSDLDVTIIPTGEQVYQGEVFSPIMKKLGLLPNFSETQLIGLARVPIVKTKFCGELDVDISFNNKNAVTNTRVLEVYSRNPKVRELGMLVKRWAKKSGLCEGTKGNLSPYSFINLSIYFLQVHHETQLPTLDVLAFSGAHDDLSLRRGDEAIQSITGWQCDLSAGELLGRFFIFYGTDWVNVPGSVQWGVPGLVSPWAFQWGTEVVSVRSGKRLPVDCFQSIHTQNMNEQLPNGFIHIEDPVEVCRIPPLSHRLLDRERKQDRNRHLFECLKEAANTFRQCQVPEAFKDLQRPRGQWQRTCDKYREEDLEWAPFEWWPSPAFYSRYAEISQDMQTSTSRGDDPEFPVLLSSSSSASLHPVASSEVLRWLSRTDQEIASHPDFSTMEEDTLCESGKDLNINSNGPGGAKKRRTQAVGSAAPACPVLAPPASTLEPLACSSSSSIGSSEWSNEGSATEDDASKVQFQ